MLEPFLGDGDWPMQSIRPSVGKGLRSFALGCICCPIPLGLVEYTLVPNDGCPGEGNAAC